MIGVGVPLGWVLIVHPSENDPGGSGSGFVSARSRAGSSARRMRAPWEHGATEWQPQGWTYHRLEEVLIAAALVSVVICMVLFLTIGGFTG